MKVSSTFTEKLGDLLKTSRFAVLVEIVIVFLPMTLGLMISENTELDQLPIGGKVVLIQGPFAFLGLIISLVFFWIADNLGRMYRGRLMPAQVAAGY